VPWSLQGRYKSANQHFRKAVAINLPQTNCASMATATLARVLYGIGHGHEMMRRVRDYVRVASEPCLEHVFDWKDTRHDGFLLKYPTTSKSRTV